ncbi:DNA-binding protein [Succinivibrio dextrinosolvens]|uniref:DNA-binding protein n=1 Tax=Succinivibrio dextrinosolvens TaxID=83771 RepID=UPI0019237EEB|nr:DNA-binding protein [Succinivibrio dextrinosolvens]
MHYLTTTELADKWSISPRRIAVLCGQKRIYGVIKKGKTWLIPNNASKPDDARRRNEEKFNVER